MFGAQMPIGDFQMPQMDTSVSQPLQMPPAQSKKKGGMFGSGMGIGEALVLGLNGYLAGRGNPIGMANLKMFNERRERADELAKQQQQYQQRRTDGFEDWVKQQAYKAANPDPANPHYFESNSGDVFSVLPGQQPSEVFHDPFRYKLVPNGMGGVQPVSIEALMGQQSLPPVGTEMPDPRKQGGPPQQGAGGFR